MVRIQADPALSDIESIDEQKWDDRFGGLCVVLNKNQEEQTPSYNTEEEQREYGFEPWYEKNLDTDLEKKAKLRKVDSAPSIDRDNGIPSSKPVVTTQTHVPSSSSSTRLSTLSRQQQPSSDDEKKGMQMILDTSRLTWHMYFKVK